MENFVYKRKALHLFSSILVFTQCTLRLGQSNFHLVSVFPQNHTFISMYIVKRVRREVDAFVKEAGIVRMMCLSNYMQPRSLMRHNKRKWISMTRLVVVDSNCG